MIPFAGDFLVLVLSYNHSVVKKILISRSI